MKKDKFPLIIVPSLILVTMSLFIYVQLKLNSLEKQVLQHLISEKGIDKTQIVDVTGRLGKAPQFGMEVIFKDEPDVRYFYREKNGSIIQFGDHSKNKKNIYKHVE